MEWTLDRIINTINNYAEKAGVELHLPVSINSKITRTLGRCFYHFTGYGMSCAGRWVPSKIEISQQLLDTCTDWTIEQVIAHETAHALVCLTTGEKHGHDPAFREMCKKIGCTNDRAVFRDMQYKPGHEPEAMAANKSPDSPAAFKYSIYCSKCHKLVGARQRACKLTKEADNFRSNCCDAEIEVIQNW